MLSRSCRGTCRDLCDTPYRNRDRVEERGSLLTEYLEATRESVEPRSRPRRPFSTALSSSSSCFQPDGAAGRAPYRFFVCPPVYSRFFVVFAPRWKGNHGALRVTGPATAAAIAHPPLLLFFSGRPNLRLLRHPDCRLLVFVVLRPLSSLPPSSSLLLRFSRAKRRPRPAEVIPSPTRNDKIVHTRQPPSTITDSSGRPRTTSADLALLSPHGIIHPLARCLVTTRGQSIVCKKSMSRVSIFLKMSVA